MKKINLKGISEILSEKEMKNVIGGYSTDPCAGTGQCNGTLACSYGKSNGGVFYGYCKTELVVLCRCK